MKKILKVVGIVAVAFAALGAGIFALVFALTGGAVDASEEFLAPIGEERFEEAYSSAAVALRSQPDLLRFEEVVRTIGLTGYQSVSWSYREIANNQASLEGSVTTVDGGTIPLSMRLVNEEGEWRVLGFETEFAGASITRASGDRGVVPNDDDTGRLVFQSMLSFSGALQRRDFAPFHGTISQLWQAQITPQELLAAFQSLIDNGVDLSNLRGLAPLFDQPPYIDGDNVLNASGYYDSEPYRVDFEVRYLYESPSWKLLGISVFAENGPEA
ncbi:MAG: hypothetical protein WEG36_10495 [Gemmatimonadota bacterium]